MSKTDELRRLMDEYGVEWVGTDFAEPTEGHPTNTSLGSEHHDAVFIEYTDGSVLRLFDLTPEQAIAATLGDSVATSERHGVAKVYLVEVSDELIEGWCPLSVYLHKESAEDCAEAYRCEEDGIRQFARVIELKVEDASPEQVIVATLGSRTCHKLPASGEKTCIVRHNSTYLTMEFGYWRCSKCGCECFEGARYCMKCGAKAVDA